MRETKHANPDPSLHTTETLVGVSFPAEQFTLLRVGTTAQDAMRTLFVESLERNEWDFKGTAKELGISLKTGYTWAHKFDLPLPTEVQAAG